MNIKAWERCEYRIPCYVICVISFSCTTLALVTVSSGTNYHFSFTAVKFGRMSKKQREKVEDEVRFHRAQMRAQTDTAPDSVYDAQQQTPSSSDQFHGHYNG